jgi:hypothetical protein
VIYETQSPFVVLERTCDRGLFEAAVDIAQCSRGFLEHGASRTGFELELDAEHASSRGPGEPVEPAAGSHRHDDTATA